MVDMDTGFQTSTTDMLPGFQWISLKFSYIGIDVIMELDGVKDGTWVTVWPEPAIEPEMEVFIKELDRILG